MIVRVLGALVLATAGSLQADFPNAKLTRSPSGTQVIQASNFAARQFGNETGRAAKLFIEKYAADFGMGPRQELRILDAGGTGSRVRLGRFIDGLPIFNGDIVVGFDATSAVVLVNASQAPTRLSGEFRLSRRVALRKARACLGSRAELRGEPKIVKGWYPQTYSTRAAWQVDLLARRPPGDWRIFIDAESGDVLLRVDRRTTGGS